MATVTFEQARACVIARLGQSRPQPSIEAVNLLDATERVLAESVTADRDYPPLDRSVRDGFAVRSADVPGSLRVIGEVKAGESFAGDVGPGQAVAIMTGAPMPAGADCVVMVEHTTQSDGQVVIDRAMQSCENVNRRGSEAAAGEALLDPGVRLDFASVALLASVGRSCAQVYRRPAVAILATGDELINVGETPQPHQIRDSNSYSLAAQVARAGGIPQILPVARDNYRDTRKAIERGLEADLLLLSGGVSAGKYDIVETVLEDLGAEFFFDRVLIQPGQPLVFGKTQGKFFFGLPGNPGSTMVTFELFARAALEMLGGQGHPLLPLTWSKLSTDFRQKTGLTRFLPARLSVDGSALTPIKWQGSGDMVALARANAFLVTEQDRSEWAAGDWIRVLPK